MEENLFATTKDEVTGQKIETEIKETIITLEKAGFEIEHIVLNGSLVEGGGKFTNSSPFVDFDLRIFVKNPTDQLPELGEKLAQSSFLACRPGKQGEIQLNRKENPTMGVDVIVYNSEDFIKLLKDESGGEKFDFSPIQYLKRILASGQLIMSLSQPKKRNPLPLLEKKSWAEIINNLAEFLPSTTFGFPSKER